MVDARSNGALQRSRNVKITLANQKTMRIQSFMAKTVDLLSHSFDAVNMIKGIKNIQIDDDESDRSDHKERRHVLKTNYSDRSRATSSINIADDRTDDESSDSADYQEEIEEVEECGVYDSERRITEEVEQGEIEDTNKATSLRSFEDAMGSKNLIDDQENKGDLEVQVKTVCGMSIENFNKLKDNIESTNIMVGKGDKKKQKKFVLEKIDDVLHIKRQRQTLRSCFIIMRITDGVYHLAKLISSNVKTEVCLITKGGKSFPSVLGPEVSVNGLFTIGIKTGSGLLDISTGKVKLDQNTQCTYGSGLCTDFDRGQYFWDVNTHMNCEDKLLIPLYRGDISIISYNNSKMNPIDYVTVDHAGVLIAVKIESKGFICNHEIYHTNIE